MQSLKRLSYFGKTTDYVVPDAASFKPVKTTESIAFYGFVIFLSAI
tara:strand:- start:980 stop:1117 length:138 start_codon:yes stop_codon:yes gene_type:complete